MRIILIFIFCSILLSSSSADEIIFDELKIKDEKHKLIKSKMQIISRYEEAKYINNFYYYSEDKVLKKFIDLAHFNASMYGSQAMVWFRNFALKKKVQTNLRAFRKKHISRGQTYRNAHILFEYKIFG